jgi:hypothetical protein
MGGDRYSGGQKIRLSSEGKPEDEFCGPLKRTCEANLRWWEAAGELVRRTLRCGARSKSLMCAGIG